MATLIWCLLTALLMATFAHLQPCVQANPPEAAIGVITGMAAIASPVDEKLTDPFPIRRIFPVGEQRATVFALESQSALTRMPRAEFESRVRAASRAVESPPRLARANYTARLTDGGLTGTAEWSFISAVPKLVTLEPLLPAISNPRRADGSPVALFREDSSGRPAASYLWLDRAGETTVHMDWSARGYEEPSLERFALTFPAAALAGMELDLPGDRLPSTNIADSLLTGPFAGEPGRSIWRLTCSGRTTLDLSIRRPSGPPPAMRVDRVARFELAAGLVSCVFELELETVHGLVSEALLDVDPDIHVSEISGAGPLTWHRLTERPPGSSPRIRIVAADGGALSRVVVNGILTKRSHSSLWSPALVRIVGGLAGEDLIDLRLDAEIRLKGLSPGDYLVTFAEGTERGYRVTLQGIRRSIGGPALERRPPIVDFAKAEADISTREELNWRINDSHSDVNYRSQIRVARGPVSVLTVDVPNGYLVRTVELVPEDPGLTWSYRPGAINQIIVEPSRPLYGGQSTTLQMSLRGSHPVETRGLTPFAIPYPRLGLAGSQMREGVLVGEISPAFRSWVCSNLTDAASVRDDGRSFVLPYRSRLPSGEMLLSPNRDRMVIRRESMVSLENDELTTVTTLVVQPSIGEIRNLTLWTPHAPDGRWEIRVEGAEVREVARSELLLAIAAISVGHGFPATCLLAAESQIKGSLWHVAFPRPMAGSRTVLATVKNRVSIETENCLPVLLPVIPGSMIEHSRIQLSSGTAAQFEVSTGAAPQTFGPETEPIIRPRKSDTTSTPRTRGWRFDSVKHAIRIEPDGRLSGILSGRVLASGSPVLSVSFPADTDVSSLSIANRQVVPLTLFHRTENTVRVELPLPAIESGGLPFEIHYRRMGPVARGVLLEHVLMPSPQLPDPTVPIELTWTAADDFRPWPTLVAPTQPITSSRSDIVLIRTSLIKGVGIILAAIFAGFTVSFQGAIRGCRGKLALYALVVGLLAVANWTLAEGWGQVFRPTLIVGFSGMIILSLLAREQPRRDVVPIDSTQETPPHNRRKPFSTVPYMPTVIGIALLSTASGAQAPEPATVFVVAGNTTTGPRLEVLVPPALLDRLDKLTHSQAPPASFISANYEGRASSDGAHFVARFRVYCAANGDQKLSLPLSGVRLEEMELDGKPAFPEASRADRYDLTLRGLGWHEITARFIVPVMVTGAERSLRFAVPDVPTSRVRFSVPPNSRSPVVKSRHGIQTIETKGDQIEIVADHGGGRSMVLQWHAGVPDNPAILTVSEACIWDLSNSSDSATMALLCRVDDGAVPGISLEVPDDTEPGRFLVRGGEGRAGEPALKAWKLGSAMNGWRRLDLLFQSPVERRFVLLFELVSRSSGTLRPTLRFPRTLGATQVESYYGLRLKGIVVSDLARSGVIDYPADAMIRAVPGVPELGLDRNPPDRSFQRATNGPPAELRPVLRPPQGLATGSAEVTWTVGQQITGEGTLKLAHPTGVSLVEFELSKSVRIDELRVPDLVTWGRSGTRIQAWLRKPARELSLRWSGSLSPPSKPARSGESMLVELPIPFDPRKNDATMARVQCDDGWLALPVPAKGVHLQSADGPTGGLFVADAGLPSLKVTLLPPQAPSRMTLHETVESTRSGLRYSARLTISLPTDRAHHGMISLAGPRTREQVELKGPPNVAIGPMEIGPTGPRWSVLVLANQAATLEFRISTAMLPGRLPEPQVTFGGLPIQPADRVLNIVEQGLAVTNGPLGWRRDSQKPAASALGSSRWIAGGGLGPWTVKLEPRENPASIAPLANRSTSIDSNPPTVKNAESFTPGQDWTAIAGWSAGLLALLGLTWWGRSSWQPERLVACGLLGGTALGSGSLAGQAFLGIAVLGVTVRVLVLLRWVSRLVVR